MFENPRRGRQARNFTANVPKILDLKSSSEQIFSENCRWVPLVYFENGPLKSWYGVYSVVRSGAPNENIVQNHLNIALLNVF